MNELRRDPSIAAMGLVLAAILAACASGGGHRRPRGGPPLAPLLFISPHGEIFHGQRGGQSGLAHWFAQADRNRDGRVTEEEFLADAAGFFGKVDEDGDGRIVPSEVSDMQWKRAPELVRGAAPMEALGAATPASARQGGRGDYGGREETPSGHGPRETAVRQQGAAAYGLLGEVEPVMAADSDLNQRVTKEEFAAAATRRFAILDTNGDGAITMDEAQKRFDERRAQNR
jgi:hypothetical protein